MVKAIIAKPATCIAAKLYQPNMVENQCASKDMMVPNAKMGKVKPNITRKVQAKAKLLL
jgi:hypothetical protein